MLASQDASMLSLRFAGRTMLSEFELRLRYLAAHLQVPLFRLPYGMLTCQQSIHADRIWSPESEQDRFITSASEAGVPQRRET